MQIPRLAALAALSLALCACPFDEPAPDADGDAPTEAAAPSDSETASPAASEAVAPTPSEDATPKAEDQVEAPPAMLAASHILVQFKGSMRATPEITRSKEEALARAKEALAKVAAGGDFAALAAEYSDGPTKSKGGSLGSFEPKRMIPEFSAAVMTLEVGALAPEPVESAFGYHVIRRDEAVFYGAKHILVQYKGAMRAKPTITRTKEEAQARAAEALAKATAGEDFSTLARAYSDGPTAPMGGDLGTFGAGMMVPAFEKAVASVAPQTLVGELVESPFGFHVIYRTE